MMTLMTLMTMCTRKVRSGPTTKRIINTYKKYYLQWDLEVGPSVVFIFGGPRSVCRSTGPIIAYYFWHCDNELSRTNTPRSILHVYLLYCSERVFCILADFVFVAADKNF